VLCPCAIRAPSIFRTFGNDILIGNVEDTRITAFDPADSVGR
jgi:hypothetical protein